MSDHTELRKLKTQFYRWLLIDEMIAAGRYPNAQSMSVEIEVSSRTIKRDIEYFRDMIGAPIAYDRARRGYYYTEANYRLPLLLMQESEIFSIFLAEKVLAQYRNTPLYQSLKTVFEKLTGYLPDTVSIPTNMLQDNFSMFTEPAPELDQAVWQAVFNALRDSLTLSFDYRNPGRSEAIRRNVDPYHVVCYRGEWYLIGFCHYGKAERIYALSRMRNAVATASSFSRPATFNAEEYFGNHFGIFRGEEEYQVQLHFCVEAAPYVLERKWHHTEVKEGQADGSVMLTFSTNHLFEVKRWVLSWGKEVTVIAPIELREDVQRELAAAARNYGG